MPIIRTISHQDDRLRVYRNVQDRSLTKWSGLFVVESAQVAKRLAESDYELESIFVSENRLKNVIEWLPADVPVYVLPLEEARKIVGYKFHYGVMACGIRKPNRDLNEFLSIGKKKMSIVACPKMTDPENMGILIRTCRALGVDFMLLGKSCVDPLMRRVSRVSVGNVFYQPIVRTDDMQRDLSRLQTEYGVKLVATILEDDAVPLSQVKPPEKFCLMFGNEGEGLKRHWIETADIKTTISMHGGTDSLNVSVAAGIFLYHFLKR